MMSQALGAIFAWTFLTSVAFATPENREQLFPGITQPIAHSVLVVRLVDGKTLYEENADTALIPASVTKLVTTAAALQRFTPKRTFRTRFHHTGKRVGARIEGDFVVVGDGDPFLVNEKLWQAVADLKHLGVGEITGDIVVDGSLFDDEWRDGSRAGSERGSDHAYDAPVSALGVNFNTFPIALAPGPRIGDPARVGIDPYDLPSVVLDNRLKTTGTGTKRDVQVTRTSGKGGVPRLIVGGHISAQQKLMKLYRSVDDPVLAAGMQLKAFFENAGIKVRGKVREGELPPGASFLHDIESYDLAFIAKGLNHYSNNYIADVITKRLGAAFPQKGLGDTKGQGTLQNGAAVLTKFLREDVRAPGPFVLQNGSGLDTANRLSASQLVAVLMYMEKQGEFFPDFIASLPAAGWGGTLSERFGAAITKDLAGKVRAKTGTLSSPVTVVSLAGYFRHPRHGWTAFAVIENGVSGKPQPSVMELRRRQDVALKNFMTIL